MPPFVNFEMIVYKIISTKSAKMNLKHVKDMKFKKDIIVFWRYTDIFYNLCTTASPTCYFK